MDHTSAKEVVELSTNFVRKNAIGFRVDENGEQLLSLLQSYYPIRSLQLMCLLQLYYAPNFQPEKYDSLSNHYLQLFDDVFPTVKLSTKM